MADDTYYMRQALQEAREAANRGEVPVGAVVVCRDRIIARAHNLTETGNLQRSSDFHSFRLLQRMARK